MKTEVLEIVDTPYGGDDDDDDDDVCVLYATPVTAKKGTSKCDAISVEDYPYTHKPTICRKRFYRGECSNTKKSKKTKLSSIPSTFMCKICVDEKPISDSFRVFGCTHSYCAECIEKYVASKLKDNIRDINCPAPGCRKVFEPQHCRSFLPKGVFGRWCDALCEAEILAAERFYCPFKGCSGLLIDDSRKGDNRVVTQSECPDCNRLFCAQCKVPWHSGIDCAGFQKLNKDERSHEDIMLMNLANANGWIRCPACKFYVSKSGGCSHIRCWCGYSFHCY